MSDAEVLADALAESSPSSAAVVVPILLTVTNAKSVVDFGCGLGIWLAEFERRGVSDVYGVDTYDPGSRLQIPHEKFAVIDLEAAGQFDRTADLALCLEVAEHLRASAAQQLVDALVRAAPVIAFSAGIPGQRGVGHLNLQWPEYWRGRFASHGYEQLDVFREELWSDERVSYWYRQNLFLYARTEWVNDHPEVPRGLKMPENVVHPLLLREVDHLAVDKQGLRAFLREIPAASMRSIKRRGRRA